MHLLVAEKLCDLHSIRSVDAAAGVHRRLGFAQNKISTNHDNADRSRRVFGWRTGTLARFTQAQQ